MPNKTDHFTIKTEWGFTLFKKPNTPFWNIRFTLEGRKQFRQSLKTTDLEDAKRKGLKVFYEITAKQDAGLHIKKTTVNDLLDIWIPKAKLRAPELSVVNRYLREYFGNTDITKITGRDIADFKEWRMSYWTEGPGRNVHFIEYERAGKTLQRPVKHEVPKSSTIHTLEAITSKFLRFCEENHYIKRVPKFTKTRVKGNVRPSFNEAEVHTIIQAATTNAQKWFNFQNAKYNQEMHNANVLLAYIEVMAGSGLRPTECLRLRWRDLLNFDPEGDNKKLGKLRIQVHGKAKHRTMVPFDSVEIALRLLWQVYKRTCDKQPKLDDYIWVYRNGNQYKTICRELDALLRRLSLKADYKGDNRDAYSLRHYHITSQLIHGVDIHLLSRNMGTSVGIIEKHYSHVTTEDGADKLKPEGSRF